MCTPDNRKHNPDVMAAVRTGVLTLLKHAKNEVEEAKSADRAAEVLKFLHDSLQENEDLTREFDDRLFIEFGEYLTRNVTIRWTGDSHRKLNDCIEVFFMSGPAEDSFLVITKSLSSDSHSTEIRTAVTLLEGWLAKGRMCELICRKTLSVDGDGKRRSLSAASERLVTRLVAIPDIVANQLHVQERSLLTRGNYYKLLAESVLEVLQFTYDNLKNGRDCSLSFVNAIFGKACLQGHADVLMSVLLPSFSSFTQSDPLWCRICQRFLTATPDRCMESVITPLLSNIEPCFSGKCVVSRLLGDAVLTNSKVKFLLTHKLLLIRFYSKISILLNIVFYLSGSEARRQLMIDTLIKVLNVWGDASALNHSSYEQHLYITQAVLTMASHMSKLDIEKHRQAVLLKLIHGVHSHLRCSVEKVRRLGMVTGECLSQGLDPNGKKLEFEYDVDDDVRLLRVLCTSHEEMKKWFSSHSGDEQLASVADDGKNKDKKTEGRLPDMKMADTDSDDDSDDELQPYAMPDSQGISRKAPIYLRDIMAGLLCHDDRDRTEACLSVVERVVRSQPDNLDEVAAELVKILLHLQDAYSLDNFVLLRHKAMVAAAVLCPRQVVPYLTAQFYERNYNLKQRMDILEVLSSAATELSDPRSSNVESQTGAATPLIREHKKELEGDTEDWKEIISKRIEAKTRRFTKGPSKPPPQPVANRLGPVAGLFFYPLMQKYDSCSAMMDLLGDDHLVLGRLISTLAVVLCAATNTPAVRQMAVALMEFVWALRYHTDRFVRHSLLYAVCMVMCNLPPAILLADLQSEIVEMHAWLQDMLRCDPDAKSQELALQTAVLLESVLKESITH